jgi:hypothetical protein
MLKLVEDRERIDIFLDKLLSMHLIETKKYQAPFLCTGAAISAAKQLVAEEGKFPKKLIALRWKNIGLCLKHQFIWFR